jgi:poly(hydroxyalkanoate) depolymerase family esterase
MVKMFSPSLWTRPLRRTVNTMTRVQKQLVRTSRQVVATSVKSTLDKGRPPAGTGDWVTGLALGATGARRYRLYRPPGIAPFERRPLLVMLHGCGQDAYGFARSTRIHRLAAREGFLVLFVEQDRHANPQGCWNWFDTRSGRAEGEAQLVMSAIDQAVLLYRADRTRVAVAGLSAGASLAALVAARRPERFRAVVMHSGVPPGTAQSTATALGAMRGGRPTAALPSMAAAQWPPLLVIHGKDDRIVSSRNARAAAQTWAAVADAREGTPRAVQRGKRHGMTVTDYRLGSQTIASLCEVERLGHAWSGGAAGQPYSDAQGPDASRLLWSFVSKQFNRA